MPPMEIPARAGRGLVHVIVDTPRGSGNKYKFDVEYQVFKLSRMLPAGMHFPYDFGSIPGTVGDDGDALDVVLIADAPSVVGCLATVRLIGVIAARQIEGGRGIRNDRLVGVPVTPVNPPHIRRLGDIARDRLTELESFFVNYNRVQGRRFTPIGRLGPAAAQRLVHAGIQRQQKSA